VLTRPAGSSGLRLSVVGFGAWATGGLWWGDDVRDEDSVAAIHAALDEGITWFDTAPLYGHGHADAILARALGSRVRDVVIATKCGPRWDNPGGHAISDLSPAHIVADVHQSLRRLGVDHLPLVQTHWPCQVGTPLEDTISALSALQAAGTIGAWGLCNETPEGLRRAVAAGSPATLQTPLSLLRREYEGGLHAVCVDHGLGVLAYEPLCRGLLTGKFHARSRFPDSDLRARDDRFRGDRFLKGLAVVERLRRVATRLCVAPATLAVAWVLRRPGVTAAIVGCKRPAQVREAAATARIAEGDAVFAELDLIAASYRA
jgi:aryl-alcohol dehydrogenase-like predicted oxidoreductase